MIFGEPLDFSRYYGQEADRGVLRAVTDEIMQEIQKLSGQEYVDTYAEAGRKDQLQPPAAAIPAEYNSRPPSITTVSRAIAAATARLGLCEWECLPGAGDCPGLNAVIRAVVRRGIQEFGLEFVGFRDGWRGPLEADTMPLDVNAVRGILPRGGTILGLVADEPVQGERSRA